MSSYSLFFILLPLFFSSANAACYCFGNNGINVCASRSSTCGPPSAGGAELCCFPGDTCGQDNVCYAAKITEGGSGFYFGGCTDSLMKDPACTRTCSSAASGAIVYLPSMNQWACCSILKGYTNCSNPLLDVTFPLFLPVQFSAVGTATTAPAKSVNSVRSSTASSKSSVSSKLTSSKQASPKQTASSSLSSKLTAATTKSDTAFTTTGTASGSNTADGNGDGGGGKLATGAKAGIAVGASILVVGLGISAGIWVMFRRKRMAAPRDEGPWRRQNGFDELKDDEDGDGSQFSPALSGRIVQSEGRPAVQEAPHEVRTVVPQASQEVPTAVHEAPHQTRRPVHEAPHVTRKPVYEAPHETRKAQQIRIGDGGMELGRLNRKESHAMDDMQDVVELPG